MTIIGTVLSPSIRLESVLRDLLKQHQSPGLPQDMALTILSEICQAIQYAHQRQVIHRDLKPENILFNNKGKYCLPNLALLWCLQMPVWNGLNFLAKQRNLQYPNVSAFMEAMMSSSSSLQGVDIPIKITDSLQETVTKQKSVLEPVLPV